MSRRARSISRSGLGLVIVLLGLLACAIGCENHHLVSGASPQPAAAPAVKLPAPTAIRGPSGGADIAAFVTAELHKPESQHSSLLVYVGAAWCEPCRRFHAALTAGELDSALAGLRFIEFDYDSDEVALRRAGYVSKLIPLFTLPKPDGTASERHIEGSIKGESAVTQNLLPRLRALVTGAALAP
jgi:thiol-disulfide isomerase/thioredoxin